MKRGCLPSGLVTALDTLTTHWARISRVVVAAGVPSAILFLGHGYSSADTIWHNASFVSFVQWFAVTCVVVALPTIGKSTQKAVERCLGSLFGGALGLLFVAAEAPLVKVLGMLVAAACGELVAIQFQKDYTGRLMPMTYLIVAAPVWEKGPGHPWLAAVLRLTSVLAGIAWTFIVSVVWFPETSSHAAFKQLLMMMQRLEGLGRNTWALLQEQQQELLATADQQQQLHDISAIMGEQRQQPQATKPAQQQQQQQQQNGHFQDATASQGPSTDSQHDSSRGAPVPPAPKVQASVPLPPPSAAAAACTFGGPSSNVCILKQGTAPSPTGSEAASSSHAGGADNQQQQQQVVLSLEQQFEGDACDEDVRSFFATRALLQDSLKAAAAERQLGWLFGRPIILPSILVPCHLSSSCCLGGHLGGPARSAPAAAGSRSSGPAGSRVGSQQETLSSAGQGPAGPTSSAPAGGSSEQGSRVCGLPPFLPVQQVRLVAIAQRHCSHVLWVLHKLLQDKFDRQALAAVIRRYPTDMLVNIQHSAQAVLQAATACLQTAMQHHRHWHRRRASRGPALLLQHLRELQGSMTSLHLHLTHWQEIFIDLNQLRRDAVLQVLGDSRGESEQYTALLHGLGSSSAFADLFFTTPSSRTSYMFVLQWHALHYILQQLDTAFAELTGNLQELLGAMQGSDLAASLAESS